MNKRRTYEAFTLIEMLVVMGILIILMVLGIAAGRFALNRAADVAHRNGADQLFEGLQAYYVDNRAYPLIESCGADEDAPCSPKAMVQDDKVLGKYIDTGAFNGGSGATYIYLAGGNNNDQAALICVTMMGTKNLNDANTEEGAYYCTGNGFDTFPMSAGASTPVWFTTNPVTTNYIEYDEDDPMWGAFAGIPSSGNAVSNWDDNDWE